MVYPPILGSDHLGHVICSTVAFQNGNTSALSPFQSADPNPAVVLDGVERRERSRLGSVVLLGLPPWSGVVL